MLLVISRLVYTRPEFVIQVQETLTALRCSKILGSVLAEPELRVETKIHALAIINRILSSTDSSPSDVISIFVDIFGNSEEHCSEVLSELLSLNLVEVTLKCLFMVGLLCRLDREASRFFLRSQRLEKLLSSSDNNVVESDVCNAVAFCNKWIKL